MCSGWTIFASQPCLFPTEGHTLFVSLNDGHIDSSYVRGMPYHSSKPWFVGNRVSALPRCHLPQMPVAYPWADNSSAMVTSHSVNPSGPPPIGTS